MQKKSMKFENSGKKRFALRRSDKIILGVVAALTLVIIALSILQRCGLSLINGTLSMYLPFLALFVWVGWGGYALVRKIGSRTARLVVGGVLVLLLSLVLVLVFTYIGFVGSITMPQRYATVRSPSGLHELVVLRALDPDEDRMESRRIARLEADPDGETEITVNDWGYLYRAYPQVMGIFYRSNANVDGEVYLTYYNGVVPVDAEAGDGAESPEKAARGTLMLEWLKDEAEAHFFVENPGVAEGGDCYVRF